MAAAEGPAGWQPCGQGRRLSFGCGFAALPCEDRPIKTSDLQYDLPPELIAQHPCEPRDAARLMVIHRAAGTIEHRVFADLPEYLTPRDCLVINRTRVLPAKFTAFRRTGGRINGLFIREEGPGEWVVLLTGAGRVKEGERLTLRRRLPDGGARRGSRTSAACSMYLLHRGERGECRVRVEPPEKPARTEPGRDGPALSAGPAPLPAAVLLDSIGEAPLPPYIRRSDNDPAELRFNDRARYQTVYADMPGAVAAPTAGLHFTPELLRKIQHDLGVAVADVVLHVGLGTFQPVEVEDISRHQMHREWFSLSSESAAAVTRTRAGGGRCVAVGTTSVRVLETCAAGGTLLPQSGWTDLCIYPPYVFRATDALVTNFHLPGSTLLALIFAFAGRELILRAYETAVRERYRFYSFGDAMLIV